MACQSFKKMIANGHVIEVWEYEKPVWLNFDGQGGRKADEESDRKEENRKLTTRRAKWNLMRLALANFDEKSKFVTLTFGADIKQIPEANKHFKRFIQRMRYKYGNFRYLVVPQFQDGKRYKMKGIDRPGSGKVHYHFLSDLPYIKKSELAEIWGNGWVKINRVDKVDNIGAYISSYMTHDIMDSRMLGLKSYEHSRNLAEPSVLNGQSADLAYEVMELGQKKEVLASSYVSEYHGTIVYRQYNLKRQNIKEGEMDEERTNEPVHIQEAVCNKGA